MTALSKTDKILCGIYAVVAIVALVATWWHNIAFFRLEGNGGLVGFIQDGYANHAAGSLTNDLLLLTVAAVIFMFVEANRVGVRYIWIYPVVAAFVAISVAFPLFLIARQLRLAATREPSALVH